MYHDEDKFIIRRPAVYPVNAGLGALAGIALLCALIVWAGLAAG